MTEQMVREQIHQVLLEVRQEMCNTEFAPAPFTEPIDPSVFSGKFIDKILNLTGLGIIDPDQSLPEIAPHDDYKPCQELCHRIEQLNVLKAGFLKLIDSAKG